MFPPRREIDVHALIIEQDAWTVLMIEDALVELGFTTFDVASSGEEALAMARLRCPDVITSDVRLGMGNGIETVQAICSERPIPVVFVTSTGWEVQKERADMAVVQKPFAPAELKAAIDEVVASATQRTGAART